HPLTSLLCFWVSEEMEKMEFLVMGVNDEFSHEPEVRYTFNVYNVYSYGKTGTAFWLLIMAYAMAMVALFTYRMFRLGFKRRSQLKRIDGLKQMMSKDFQYRVPLQDYKKDVEPSTPERRTHQTGISLELAANE